MNRFIWVIVAGFVILGLGMLSMAGLGLGDMPMMGGRMGMRMVMGFAFLLLVGALFGILAAVVLWLLRGHRTKCPICTRPVQVGWSYCPYCGTELRVSPGLTSSFDKDTKTGWWGNRLR
ncbi:zinc ribbon domain-containing protein [Alicyclobacillaceae bacterium I2511]|nr:zinc ribbon domain-containing protein [Alicyclobacillaceae bacterium I2511]